MARYKLALWVGGVVLVGVTAFVLSRKDCSSAQDIGRVGGIAYHEWNGPQWLGTIREATGFNLGAPVVDVELGDFLTDRDFLDLRLCYLKELSLHCPRLTVASVEGINRLENIEVLHLTTNNVSDEWIERLHRLERLHLLNLMGTRVTDKLADEIGKFPNVRFLNVAGTKVTAKGLGQLATLPNLESITVSTEQANEISAEMRTSIAAQKPYFQLKVMAHDPSSPTKQDSLR